jgi:RNA polymerase sigma-70 factor (ECF subfamily)
MVMPNDSDRVLVQQIRQGDARAWENLIARYEGRLLAFVDRRLHDRASSEDVIQETFVGFVNSLPNFDDQRELQTYLFTIASHKLTDHLRKKGRHPLHHLPANSGEPPPYLDPNPGASTLARSQERRQLESAALTRALRELIASWRQKGEYHRLKVVELLWVKGWANRDVAALLRISEQQVANLRHAAVTKLHDQVSALGLSPAVFPELAVGH